MKFTSAGKLVAQLARRPVARAAAWLRREHAMILMFHRFEDPGLGVRGHRLAELRQTLALFRSAGIELIALDTLVEQLRSNPEALADGPARCAVTIDDGYADAFDIAGPVFTEFDCPYTVFVVPDVIDRDSWFWWDQISYLFANTARRRLDTLIGGSPVSVHWASDEEREHASAVTIELVKRIAMDTVPYEIAQLEVALGVELPTACPAPYRIANWRALRSAERGLATIGAHTMTHPILSSCTSARAEHEIVTSLQRVREEMVRPSKVFCYPNGSLADFGPRETEIVSRTSAIGAVSTLVGTIKMTPTTRPADWFFRIPRIPFYSRKGAAMRALLLSPR